MNTDNGRKKTTDDLKQSDFYKVVQVTLNFFPMQYYMPIFSI